MKSYSAQSGYVYQYFYEGQRPFERGRESGTEFVFTISHDRKNWLNCPVLVTHAALASWQSANARELSPTERYAVAKMALFQAFDERSSPDRMRDAVEPRPAQVNEIIESLGL